MRVLSYCGLWDLGIIPRRHFAIAHELERGDKTYVHEVKPTLKIFLYLHLRNGKSYGYETNVNILCAPHQKKKHLAYLGNEKAIEKRVI